MSRLSAYARELALVRSALERPLQELEIERLAAHNRSYTAYAARRFEGFVETEWPYYVRVLQWYRKNVRKGSTVLEVGTFIPVLPLLLTWDGYRVTTIEKLELYGDALAPIVRLLGREGIEFRDADIMDPAFDPGSFDVVNLLAVVEHLLGSPKRLLLRIQGILQSQGALVFAVPNQARLVRRLGLFFGGISVQPDFAGYFESEYPFSGHHREYTRAEVVHALTSAGFRIEELDSVRYPPTGSMGKRAITVVGNLMPLTFHQMLFAVARKG